MAIASHRISARVVIGLVALLIGACTSIEGPPPRLIDPLGLNWRVEQRDLGNERYAILMTKNLLTTGGDGESARMFRKRVADIQRERGYSSFEVIEFSEGIESNVLTGQRVSRGVVQFAR